MKISVIIPAYNEASRIGPTIKRLISYLPNHFEKFEIIVVDDSSKDKTAQIAGEYAAKAKHANGELSIIHNKENRGKGFSVKAGMLKAKYPLVLFSDSDLATPIEEVEKLISHIGKYDIAIASRNMKDSVIKTKQSFFRRLIGKMFPLVVNIFALRGIKDTQCGFKLFKKSAARKIAQRQTIDRFCFDVEQLIIAKQLGYKIMEVPVVWIDQKGSTVNPIKDSFRMLRDVFKIKINSMKGKYK